MRKIAVSFMLLSLTSCGNSKTPETMSPEAAKASQALDAALKPSLSLLSRIRLSPTHAFEIYAVGSQNFAYSEIGSVVDKESTTLKEDDLTDPIEVFHRLAPQEPVNKRLTDFMAARPHMFPTTDTAHVAYATEQAPVVLTPRTSAAISDPDVEVNVRGLGVATAGGGAAGSCPFSPLFSVGQGPLGPFCPQVGSVPFLWCGTSTDFYWSSNYRTNPRVSVALETVCANVGQATMDVQVTSAGDTSGTHLIAHDTFFIPPGFWRQWKAGMGCGCDCFACIFCTHKCDNLGVVFNTTTVPGGNFQLGAYITPWN